MDYIQRRDRKDSNHLGLKLSLVVPVLAAARFVEDGLWFDVALGGLFTLTLILLVFAMTWKVLQWTVIRWESRHLPTLRNLWILYSVAGLGLAAWTHGPALLEAASPVAALTALASIRLPLGGIAPAVLVGPIAWALARDAYELSGPTHDRALLKGYLAVGTLLVVPVAVYLFGAWWATLDPVPHIWTWSALRTLSFSLVVAVLGAGLAAVAGILRDHWRWRRQAGDRRWSSWSS